MGSMLGELNMLSSKLARNFDRYDDSNDTIWLCPVIALVVLLEQPSMSTSILRLIASFFNPSIFLLWRHFNYCFGFVGLMMECVSNVRFLMSCQTSIRWGVKE